MLEGKLYTKAEMVKLLDTQSNQGISRKLDRYGIEYEIWGHGENKVFRIIQIHNKFKVYCITQLKMPAQTDFAKFRNFVYYFLNDDDFCWLPDEIIEIRMQENGRPMSRQTIHSYKRRLEALNLISSIGGEYVYYFASGHKQRIVEKAEYCKAWQEYWAVIRDGCGSSEAIVSMCNRYGGVARKQLKIAINGLEMPVLNELNDLAIEAIENNTI